MDQAVVAGIGNVYRCELLYRHRVDPFRPGREIRRATWRAMWDDICALMPLGIAAGQIVTMPDQVEEAQAALAAGQPVEPGERRYLVYRRAQEPCRSAAPGSAPRWSPGETCSGAAAASAAGEGAS